MVGRIALSCLSQRDSVQRVMELGGPHKVGCFSTDRMVGVHLLHLSVTAS